MKAFILLSGGIDSMACVNFYKALNYEVECIFCDYGQPASISEKQASQIKRVQLRDFIIPEISA